MYSQGNTTLVSYCREQAHEDIHEGSRAWNSNR